RHGQRWRWRKRRGGRGGGRTVSRGWDDVRSGGNCRSCSSSLFQRSSAAVQKELETSRFAGAFLACIRGGFAQDWGNDPNEICRFLGQGVFCEPRLRSEAMAGGGQIA